ncbi:MAG TPA: hypothetical protein ENK57_20470 [Polyangiaceae bacterium]|nr:hypothetical protein [Polyangiaceae bacterium]
MNKPIVVIESPFAGINDFEIERNARYLRAAIRDCLLRDEAPYASHAIYTLPGVLDDNIPAERELGIEAGFVFRYVASCTVVYQDLGISHGMQRGIDHAIALHPIDYRRIPSWAG